MPRAKAWPPVQAEQMPPVGTRRGASGARRRHLFHLAAGSDRFYGLPAPPPFPGRLRRDAGSSRSPGAPGTEHPRPLPAAGARGWHLRPAAAGAPRPASPGAERLWPAALSWSLPDPSPAPNRCFRSLPFFPLAFSLFKKRYCVRGASLSGAAAPLSGQAGEASGSPGAPRPGAVPRALPSPSAQQQRPPSGRAPTAPPAPRRPGAGRAVPRSPARASFAGRGAPSPEPCPREGVTAASGAAGASGQGKPGPRLPPARWAAVPGPPSVTGRSRESSGLRRGFPARAGGRGSAGRGETAHSGRDFPPGWRSPSPGSSCRPPPRSPHTLAGRAAAGLGSAGRRRRRRREGGSFAAAVAAAPARGSGTGRARLPALGRPGQGDGAGRAAGAGGAPAGALSSDRGICCQAGAERAAPAARAGTSVAPGARG